MDEIKFTTGQILGITLINRMTLFRYVKDFHEFFSETAKQHKKGRRWTVNDLEVVQAIRYLHHEHKGNVYIRQLLSKGWRSSISRPYDIESISRLLNRSFTNAEEARQLLADATKQLQYAKFATQRAKSTWDNTQYLMKRLGQLDEEITRIKYFLKASRQT